MEPPSGFEQGTPGLGIQRLNHAGFAINSRVDEKSCTQPEIRGSSTNMEKGQSRNEKEGSHPGKSKEKEQKEERSYIT